MKNHTHLNYGRKTTTTKKHLRENYIYSVLYSILYVPCTHMFEIGKSNGNVLSESEKDRREGENRIRSVLGSDQVR